MRKPKGILYTRAGEKIVHTAESVILITSTVPEGGVGTRGEIMIDNDVLNMATYVNMVSELLIIMEEHGGANLVAQAIAGYAHETGKVIPQENGIGLATIKARKEHP